MDKIKFIETIRQFIADGKTDEALTLMRAQVNQFDPSLVTDATLLESRYTHISADFTIKGILPREDYDRTVAQINYALLEIVEKLEKTALLSTATAKSKNSGRILHNIPGIMPVGKERRCIVRIAYDDETLLRDLKVDDNTTIQSVRIAEVMGVELVDFNETPAFSIRTITEEEQFISADDYTQWLFMVKALREGKYPLTLKVAVIEEVNGKERKRDIVLEKEVFIIGNIEEPVAMPAPANVRDVPPQPSATHFEDTPIRFNYIVNEEKGGVATVASKRFSMSSIMSTVGVIVMAMVGFVTFKSFNPWREGKDITVSEVQKDPKESNGSNQGNSPSPTGTDTSTKLIEPPINPNEPAQGSQGGAKKDTTKGYKTDNNNYPVDAIKDVPPPKGKIETKTKLNTPTNSKANTPTANSSGKAAVIQPKLKSVPTKRPPKLAIKIKPNPSVNQTPITESPITSGNAPVTVPNPTQTGSTTEKEAEVKTYRVRLVLKGQMKKAEIFVDGQSVDKFLKRSIWGTPQYIEFKSSKERHTITFKRDNVSCSVTDILIENGDLSVEPCSF